MDLIHLQRMTFKIIRNLNRSQMFDLNALIRENLKGDFIIPLPIEIAINISTKLPFIYIFCTCAISLYKIE